MRALFLLALVANLAVGVSSSILSNYEVWCQGICDHDAKPSMTKPGVVMMGGGVRKKFNPSSKKFFNICL